MTTSALLHYALVSLLAGVGGAGFALIVQASPLGRLSFKPFSCRVCLSGWGTILVAGWMMKTPLWGLLPHAWPGVLPLAWWCCVSFIGIGVANVVLRAAVGDGAAPPLPDFQAGDEIPPSDK